MFSISSCSGGTVASSSSVTVGAGSIEGTGAGVSVGLSVGVVRSGVGVDEGGSGVSVGDGGAAHAPRRNNTSNRETPIASVLRIIEIIFPNYVSIF
jgi:hypothetical protein